MPRTALSSADVGDFCENMALMQAVGIPLDEGAHMLVESYGDQSAMRAVLDALYARLAAGSSLADAMEGAQEFPAYAVAMVRNGEQTGNLENTLRSLSRYYDEQARLFSRIRTSVAYPCALLCVMSIILAFTVIGIMPVFMEVYDNMAGGLSAASFGFVQAGVVIGWVALIVTLVLTLIALWGYFSSRSEAGRDRLMRIARKMPGLRNALYKISLSRFVSALAVYTASGSHADDAMRSATEGVDDEVLKERVLPAYEAMVQPIRPLGLVQALTQFDVLDELHGRMLSFGMRSGSIDDVLSKTAEDLFDEGIDGMDAAIDAVEPLLIALLTLAVGCTLVAVMLPLVGILGSIG